MATWGGRHYVRGYFVWQEGGLLTIRQVLTNFSSLFRDSFGRFLREAYWGKDVVSRSRVDIEKVMASLATTCTECGHQIHPSEVRRVGFDKVLCPKCGATFVPKMK